jgi:tape measure domain-containing protein
MAGYSTTIGLNDKMSPVLKQILQSQKHMLDYMRTIDKYSAKGPQSMAYSRVQKSIDSANNELLRMNNQTKLLGQNAEKAGRSFGGWGSRLMGAAAAFLSLRTAAAGFEKFTGVSDELTNINARTKFVSDGTQTDAQFSDKIFRSAQESRGSYTDTAKVVSRLGLLAGESFSDNDEIIKFTDTMNKMFKVSGASGSEQTAAMYQLSQAMAAGKLQGDEYRSITENAPMLADAIARYTGMSKSMLKELSSEGKITAEIIKGAMFAVTDEVNAKFATMPLTWGDAMQYMKNETYRKLAPASDEFSKMLNSADFRAAMDEGVALIGRGSKALTEFIEGLVRHRKEIAEAGRMLLALGGGLAAVSAAKTLAPLLNIGKTFKDIAAASWSAAVAAEAQAAANHSVSAASLQAGASSTIAGAATRGFAAAQAGAAAAANGLKAALMANPLFFGFTLAAVVGTGIYALMKFKSATDDVSASIEVETMSLRQLKQAQADATRSYAAAGAEIDKNEDLGGKYVKTVDELQKKAKLNAHEEKQLQAAVAGLNSVYPSLGLQIDTITNKLNTDTAAIRANIDALTDMARAQAIQSRILDIDKQIWEGEDSLIVARKKMAVAQISYNNAEKQLSEYAKTDPTGIYGPQIKVTENALEKANAEYNGTYAQQRAQKDERERLIKELEKYADPQTANESSGPVGVYVTGGKLDEIKISEEDIKLLKDVAGREFELKFSQITPQLSVQFGDVRETADARQIMSFIEGEVAEAIQSQLI